MKKWKEHNLLGNTTLLREADSSKMTIYAGFDHDDYEDPIFSAEKSDISGYEYRSRITAPIGTYVIFMWDDEECFFLKTKSPEKVVASWVKEFKSQVDNGEDCWYLEDEITGALELDKEDSPTPEEAAKEAYNIVIDSEPDGDSNYGVIWKKIEDFVR